MRIKANYFNASSARWWREASTLPEFSLMVSRLFLVWFQFNNLNANHLKFIQWNVCPQYTGQVIMRLLFLFIYVPELCPLIDILLLSMFFMLLWPAWLNILIFLLNVFDHNIQCTGEVKLWLCCLLQFPNNTPVYFRKKWL